MPQHENIEIAINTNFYSVVISELLKCDPRTDRVTKSRACAVRICWGKTLSDILNWLFRSQCAGERTKWMWSFFCNRKTSNACCEINTLLGFSWLVMVLVYGFPILFYVSEFLIIKCWIGMIWLWLLRRRCGRPLAYYRTHNMTVKEVPLKLSWHKGSYLGSSYWILRNSNITFLHSGTQQLFNAD